MAVTRASKIISLTNYATGASFSLSTNKLIWFKAQGSNTLVKYISQWRTIKTVLVTEAVATIHTATLSNTLYASQAITLTDDVSTVLYIMSDRIIEFFTLNSGDYRLIYDEGSEGNIPPFPYTFSTPSPATLNTANGNTLAVITQPTADIPSKTLYINNLFMGTMVGEPAGSLPDINFTTKVKTGTGLVTASGVDYTNPIAVISDGVTGTLTTKVISASINDAGTGGTPGAATVTGTSGTGTPFQADVTIGAGGDITSIDAIAVVGNYTVPPGITAEPVTGGGLVGATLDLSLGLLAFNITGSSTGLTAYPTFSVTDVTGTGGTITASVQVESPMTIVDPGSNLNTAPILTFSATTGTLATATSTLDAAAQNISSTTLTAAGSYKSGTDAYPTLAISGGSGAKFYYDNKKGPFAPIQVEETTSQIATAINAL